MELRWRQCRVADRIAATQEAVRWSSPVQPLVDIEQVDLLGPEHSRERLTLHQPLIVARRRRMDRRVELVGLGRSCRCTASTTRWRVEVSGLRRMRA